MAFSPVAAWPNDKPALHNYRTGCHPRRPDVVVQDCFSSGTAGLLDEAMDLLSDGIILTNRFSRVLYANRSARGFISRGLLSTRDGWLQAAVSHETQTLQALIAACVESKGKTAHMRVSARLCLTITRLKTEADHQGMHGVSMILLRDVEVVHGPPPQSTIAYFGLTPAEARLARDIINGDGLTRCARRLGIRVTTVRSHLKHIFEKTETKRQADLVRLLLSCGSSSLSVEPGSGDGRG